MTATKTIRSVDAVALRALTDAEIDRVAGGNSAYPPIAAAAGITNARTQATNTPAVTQDLMPIDQPY